jgi:NADH-quinone oxidoreductase subunit M
MLSLLIFLLILGGAVAWLSSRWSSTAPRWISMVTALAHIVLLIVMWVHDLYRTAPEQVAWLVEARRVWIPQLGIGYHLSIDGFSLLLVILSNLLGILAIAASWDVVRSRIGFFHFNLMWILAALVGLFEAMDLFLFYFFWELVLVPLYFLIAIWGYENRHYAAIKFFLFTQASGLFLLLAILGLYFAHARATGVYTFNYFELIGTPMSVTTAFVLMLGFFIAFAVKLPVVPFHTWLPDAHTEAPTAGSVDLAGLVLKIGAYGMIRFLIPLFPRAAADFAVVPMILGIVGIFYGAMVAFAQTDLKRLVAYTSISHMGFVLLGIFAWNELALQGAVMIMIAHGLSTGGLFILVGDMYDRLHTRELSRMGGLWATVPRMGAVGLFLSLASLGLPGLANFVGEILVLFGAYRANVTLAALATAGFIVATIYSVWVMQRVFYGANVHHLRLRDSNAREMTIFATVVAVIVWLGIYPHPVLLTARPALETLQEYSRRPVPVLPAGELPPLERGKP